MFCKHCGTKLENAAQFCANCGAAVEAEAPVAPERTAPVIPPENRPLSPWAYFGLQLLFAIPIVGFVFLIVFSCSSANINRRNFARSYWCSLVIALVIAVAIVVIAVATGAGLEAFYY